MKRILLVTIVLQSMFFMIANVSLANIPAPPANQQLGVDDSIFNDLEEADCRACHDSATHPCSTSNVDRHHLQYGLQLKQGKCSVNLNNCLSDEQCNPGICEINGTPCSIDANCPDFPLGETCGEVCRGETAAPDLDADNNGVTDTLYGCLSCHRQETVGGIIRFIVERDCLECHIQVPGEGSVHHLTQTAQGPAPLGDPNKGDCTPCHGTIVDDIGDGHLIPSYTPSLVTPTPSEGDGLPLNSEGNGAGACDYCHSSGTGDGYVPGTDTVTGVVVYGNEALHHNTGVYLSETGAVNDSTCTWCHYVPPLPPTSAKLKIRKCEGCHGYDSLHNIAADSDTNCFYNPADPTCTVNIGGESPGYSHVGNDSDCWGCHGFAQSYADGSGPSAPSIRGSEDMAMTVGTDTSLTLTGAALTNLIGDWQWVSDVQMTDDNGTSVILTPTSITAGSITVTIPGATPPGNYALRAVKAYDGTAYAESNPVVISVKPAVVIAEAVISSTMLTITGTGFGEAPPAGAEEYLNVKVNGQIVDVISWTDTEIVAALPAFGASADGGTITVSALFCNDAFQGGAAVECQVDAECIDANLCDGQESCVANECVEGTPLNCDDQVDCTVDTCLPQSGCQNTPDDDLCDDGNPDTTNVCDPGSGCMSCNLCPCNPNGDDKVDLADLIILKSEFGRTDCCNAGAEPCRSDCAGLCKVDLNDLVALKVSFFKTNCCN